MPEGARSWAPWLLVSLAVLVADRATKMWIGAAFQPGESLALTPFFSLALTYNPGAAFSFLADAGGWQRWFFTAITIVVSAMIVAGLRRQHGNPVVALALALVLGGALGNLYDRVTLGQVVDFVVLHAGAHAFPAFNVADSAITVGVAILIWDGLWPRGARAPRPAGEEKP
jgi:signal peptidase II